jgi:hypothetical protein
MPEMILSGFGVEIEVSKQLVVSPDKVTITLRVFNGTPQAVKLDFQEQPPEDIIVKDREGKEVWKWSHGKFFPQVIPPSVTVTKDNSLVFEQTWDLKDNDGKPVGMGPYTVEGVVRSKPCPMKAATILEIGAKALSK